MNWNVIWSLPFLLSQYVCAQPDKGNAWTTPPVLQEGCLLPDAQRVDTRLGGNVGLTIKVSAEGKAIEVDVSKSSGIPEQDIAFQQAVMQCSFKPAELHALPMGTHERVVGVYQLEYAWHEGATFKGVTRCFPPKYPSAARRLQEQALVRVHIFRSEQSGEVEYQVDSVPNVPRLMTHSLEVVKGCFAHPEVLEDIPVGKWSIVPFHWKLN